MSYRTREWWEDRAVYTGENDDGSPLTEEQAKNWLRLRIENHCRQSYGLDLDERMAILVDVIAAAIVCKKPDFVRSSP